MTNVTVRVQGTVEVDYDKCVDVDLGKFDADDLKKELEIRCIGSRLDPRTMVGRESVLIERYHAEIQRQITAGRRLTTSEKEFWSIVHQRDV